jgi:putative glycosyltransferase (TIGR04372 family)
MHPGRATSTAWHTRRLLRILERLVRMGSTPVWIVVVILLRAVRPLRVIRLGGINAGRLGHLVMDLEMFCSERQAGIHSTDTRVSDLRYVWTGGLPVCNQLLLDLWKPRFRLGPRWLLQPLDTWNRKIPGGSHNAIPYRKGPDQLNQHNDLHDVLRRTRTQLPCPPDLVRQSEQILERVRPGFDLHGRYVCIHVRDESYFAQWGDSPLVRDTTRNAAIDTYEAAIKYLLDYGFGVVRLGASTSTPVNFTHPHLWDYASDGSRSELLDLVLPRFCHFFISTLSGPDKIAQAFRRPILFTNLAPLKSIPLWMPNSLIAPKRYRGDDDSNIPWQKVFASEMYTKSESELEFRGIRLAHNSEHELLEATREMVSRLSGVARDDLGSDQEWSMLLEHVPRHLLAGGVRARWAQVLMSDDVTHVTKVNS